MLSATQNQSGKVKKLALGFLFIIILEIVVFNFNSYHLWFRDYEEKTLYLEDARGSNVYQESTKSYKSKYEFDNIKSRVGTIHIDAVLPSNKSKSNISITYLDATSSILYGVKANMSIINGYERSKTIPCQFSGNVEKLIFEFDCNAETDLKLNQIVLNKPVSFHFSFIRMGVLFFLFFVIYQLLNSKVLNKSYNVNKKFCKYATLAITGIFIAVSGLVMYVYSQNNFYGIVEDFRMSNGNQMTQGLVDAFRSGQLSLLVEPSEALKSLDNPYDLKQRSVIADALWDHCLYDGKYYSYYGIAPVVLLFLPYNLITGYYFPSNWAVLIFSIVGIVFLSLVYMQVIKKWFSKIQTNWMLMGLVILHLSSGIWFSLARPKFYEIAIASGFMFVTMGAYSLLSSNVISEGKISLLKVVFASTAFSLAVLSRPTTGVYAVVSLVFLFFGYKKLLLSNKKISISSIFSGKSIKFLLCTLVPFAVFGGVQMLYNYLRFDSIFSFGIEYSLTINDFLAAEYHNQFVLVSIFSFLFATPYFKPSFPYVFSQVQTFNLNGYYFIDDMHANAISLGLFFRATPMFFYVGAKKAISHIPKSLRKKAVFLVAISCFLAPLIIIISVWESGYAIRYNADFSWQMVLGALMCGFICFMNVKTKELKPIITKIMIAMTLLALVVNFAQVYSFIKYYAANTEYAAKFFIIERIFDFWQ